MKHVDVLVIRGTFFAQANTPRVLGRPTVRSTTRVGRTEYYDDSKAPKASTLIPAGNLLVVNDDGAILLQRRRDTGQWALPGGAQDSRFQTVEF